MTRPPSKFPPGAGSLDLGLSALLDPGEQGSVKPSQALVSEVPVSVPPVAPSAEPLSEFEEYAEAQNWKALGKLCDERLPPQVAADERLELLEVRLWWARSQQQLAGVPLSILSAPLEDIAQKLLRQLGKLPPPSEGQRLQRLKKLAASLLTEVGIALREQGDEEVSNRLAELSAMFCAAKESKQSTDKGGSFAMPGSSLVAGGLVEASVPPRLRKSLDSKERLRSGFEAAPGKNAASAKDEIPHAEQSSSRKRMLFLLVGIAALVLALNSLFGGEDLPTSLRSLALWEDREAAAPARPLADGIPEPQMKSAAPELVTGVNQLDSILEDIKNDRSQVADLKTRQLPGSEAGAASLAPRSGASNSVAEQSPAPGTALRQQSPALSQKEKIDMSGPREPADFPRRDFREGLRPRENPRGAPDTPPRRDPSSRDAPSNGASRGPPERPGFEEFRRPRTYRTLVETDVMVSPTIRARVLDTLPSSVEVLVEGREGYWLRVRSQKGNVGFILAQDAVRQD